MQSESSGLGQFLSVLEGTGALAGWRDRQDIQYLGPLTLTSDTAARPQRGGVSGPHV